MPGFEQPLSVEELQALREMCGPVGVLGFPPVGIIRVLRQLGYIRIVLGGVQITSAGLERLLRERRRAAPDVDTREFAKAGGSKTPFF